MDTRGKKELHKRKNFFTSKRSSKLRLHNKLPLCSDDERWKKKDSWAVRKKAQKRALRVLDTEEEAIKYMEWHKNTDSAYMPKYTGGYEIDFRQGEYNRCKGNYCSVADFCQQYNKGVKNGKEEN